MNAARRIRLAASSAGVTDRDPVEPGERDPEPGVPGRRLGFHGPAFPCNEGLDSGLAFADQPERHRLHPGVVFLFISVWLCRIPPGRFVRVIGFIRDTACEPFHPK